MADEISIVVRAEDQFSNVLGNFGNIITGIKSAIDLAGEAFHVFADFAMQGLDAIASYERLELSLQSLIASQIVQAGAARDVADAMETAGLKAEELVAWNEQLAINSPFTSEGVAQAFRMAMAYGFTVDEAKRLTEAMIDFAAGSGATEYAMTQIARALGQISATGRLTGGDMLQLVNAGLPVAQILADAFGVTTAQIMDMREKGLIPAQEAIEAITVYLETNFAGAAERQATSWAGLRGTFEDLQKMGLREFFGGLFEAIQPLAVALSQWLQSEGLAKLREWGDAMASFALNVRDSLETFFFWLDFGKTPLEAFDYVLTNLARGDGPLANLAEIILNVKDKIMVFVQEVTPGLTTFIQAITPGIQDFQLAFYGIAHDVVPILREQFPIIVESFRQFGTEVLPIVITMIRMVGNWFFDNQDLIVHTIERMILVFEALVAMAIIMARVVGPILVTLTAIFLGLSRVAMTVFTQFNNVGTAIIEGIVSGMRNAATAWIAWAGYMFNSFINFVKAIFRISSPSGVFHNISVDIIQGLINGVVSMTNSVLGTFTTLLNRILALPGFRQIAEFFGISSTGSSLGTTGGRDTASAPGSGGTISGYSLGGGLASSAITNSSQGVVNNYYGPVYFMGAGEPGAYYDCPYPNPVINSGTRQIRTTAF